MFSDLERWTVEQTVTTQQQIAVMAVDNLPCELPLDASEDFGEELMKEVIPQLLSEDPLGIIDKATETTSEGTLNEHFSYLQPYLEGKE